MLDVMVPAKEFLRRTWSLIAIWTAIASIGLIALAEAPLPRLMTTHCEESE